MRPVSSTILVVLLAGVCGLCVVQWSRESDLRDLGVGLRNEVTRLAGANQDLENRGKAADAEVLRLTASLGELRTTSISKQQHEEQVALNTQLREVAEKQNVSIKEQNEAIKKQNDAIQQQNESIQRANETIKKVSDERDTVTKKLNELTAKFNKLQAQDAKPAAAE